MATKGVRRTRKEEPPMTAGFDGDGVRSSGIRDVKRESISGRKFVNREGGSSRVRSHQGSKAVEDGGAQVSVSEKKNRFSSVSLPRRLLNTSMAPILSLRRVRITKSSTGQFVVFLLRVATLEAVRRVSMARCPQVWWGLQGISLLQAPPFSWLLRWAPLRHLVDGTQSFSKPLIFLSLATAVSSAVDEFQQTATGSDPNVLHKVLTAPQNSEGERAQASETISSHTMDDLRQALERAQVEVPERFQGQELENFFVAASGNIKKFVAKVQKSISWRQTYYFLTAEELKEWSHLVSWHDLDAKLRPTLIIRLGPAYVSLAADERPRFCQAVVSQVEYGILHLLNDVDPRITVIMDCKGTTALGFPVQMMKTCAVLVQDNYPTRLASLFAVNLPPVVRVLSNAVVQVIGQSTKEKLSLLGDVYLTALSEHMGGTDKVPACLGGACHCPACMEERRFGPPVHQVFQDSGIFSLGRRRPETDLAEDETPQERAYEEDVVSNYQSYNTMLRIAIIGFLMLWILISLVAGAREPELHPT